MRALRGSVAIALLVICVPLLYQGLSGRLLPNLGRLLYNILAGTMLKSTLYDFLLN